MIDNEDLKKYLLDRISIDANGCWLWKLGKERYGFAQFNKHGDYAHRMSYLAFVGKIEQGMWVLHKCDVKRCINPDHLYLGTITENTRDAVERGRVARGDKSPARLHPESRPFGDKNGSHKHPERVARGERVHGAKLTAEQVKEIREIYSTGSTQEQIATLFGISRSAVGNIVRRDNWRHVEIANGR